MVVIFVIGLALVGLGIFIRGRSGPELAYGSMLAGALIMIVSALAMAGVIQE